MEDKIQNKQDYSITTLLITATATDLFSLDFLMTNTTQSPKTVEGK